MSGIIPQFLNKVSNSNFVKNHVTKSIKDPSFLTKTLLLTSVSKDVFAYALRVNNVAKNKEIPEDKKHEIRSFMQQSINKQELMNETWGCVQYKDPFDFAGLQACFTPWAQRKGQELTNYITNSMQQY